MPFTVVYDANVLYPAPLRDLLLEVGAGGEFRARYSAGILDEVFDNLVANHPRLEPARLERTRALMQKALPDVLVTGHRLLAALARQLAISARMS